MSNLDGDEKYQYLENKIESNEELTKEDVVVLTFIPLMKSKRKREEMTLSSIELAEQISDEKRKLECVTLLYALFDKFADEIAKRKFKEVFTMTDVGRMIFEEGKEEGIEKGIEKGKAIGRVEGKVKVLTTILTRKFKKVPKQYIDNLKSLPEETIDAIIIDVLEMNDIKELEAYF